MYWKLIWPMLKRMPKVMALIFNFITIFLTIFLLVGCANLSNDSTFLVRYKFDNNSPFYSVIQKSFNQTEGNKSLSGLERVNVISGYMGVCIRDIPQGYDDNVKAKCYAYPLKDLKNTQIYKDLSIELYNAPVSSDVEKGQKELPVKLNILELAESTSKHVVHPYILMATVILTILTFLMLIYTTIRFLPFRYWVLRASLFLSAFLVLFWGLGTMWTHVGIHVSYELVPSASMGIINTHRGLKAAAMSWTSFAFLLAELIILWFLYLKDRKNLSEEIDKIRDENIKEERADSLDSSSLNYKI